MKPFQRFISEANGKMGPEAAEKIRVMQGSLQAALQRADTAERQVRDLAHRNERLVREIAELKSRGAK